MNVLQKHREARGWSKAETARRAELNAATVGWIESGRFQAYRSQLMKLAKALSLSAQQTKEFLLEVGHTSDRGPSRSLD